MLTRALVCLLVTVAVGCGGGGSHRAAAPSAPTPTTTPTASKPDTPAPADALLGIVKPWSGAGAILAPVDRRTLEPAAPWAELGEYHDAWSLSPDRRLAAFGISAPGESGRIGIRVIDLGTLLVVKDIEAGIVAEAVGWIAPHRLAAFLQSGEVIVVDPLSGREVARENLGAVSCPFTPPNAVTPLGFVFVVPVAGAAVVVMADAEGRLQRAKLDDVALGFSANGCQEAGLAVDPERLVAYVAGAGARIAAIDLRTMRVRRHARLAGPGCRGCGTQRSALWLGGGRFVVTGFDMRQARSAPAGLTLVDTRDWSSRRFAGRAGAARLAGNRLLVYDGRHPSLRPTAGLGLRVYDRAGRLVRTFLRGRRVGDVQIAGARAYARTRRGLRVVDLRRGKVIDRLPRQRRDVALIAAR